MTAKSITYKSEATGAELVFETYIRQNEAQAKTQHAGKFFRGIAKPSSKIGYWQFDKLLLPEAFGKQIAELLDQAQNEYDATPERQMEVLISKRTSIIAKINASRNAASEMKTRGFENETINAASSNEFEQDTKNSEKELSEFDEQNPEVTAEIETRNQKSINQSMWN